MNNEFNFNLIEKVLFLLNEKWRYKVVFGGRGCLDGDSLLDTPNGKIKVKDFSGGKVFSFDGKNIISVFAEKPVVYSKEKLFKLETENNSIITTGAHRFLTPAGWKRLDEIKIGDYVFSNDSSFFQKEFYDHFQKHYEECQLMCLLNVQHCFYKLLNCLYHCWQGFHQYDEQPLSEVKTYQDVLQQLACELPHKSRVLSQKGDLDIFCINDLTYQFLYHLSNLAFVQDEEGKSSAKQGNYICEKSSELLLVSYQLYRLFDEKKDLVLLVQELSKQLLSVYNLLGQDENLKKVFDILLCEFENNPYSDSLNNCIHDHHYNIFFEKVKQIKYEKTDVFYDLFIPVYNCYFANGILHHNSGKSYAFADCCLIKSLEKPIRILCARQLQNSIRDSVHKLLCDRIEALKLNNYFYITRESIKGLNGSEFIFKGIQNNVNEIKSMEGIDICWIEEAQSVSNESWEILIPTIRKEDSEIWISFNPDREDDATYKKFVKNPPENCKSVLLNYTDNPYFPDVLKKEMEYCKKVDFEKYEHIWLGKTILQTEAQIFRGKYELKDFEARDEERFFFGADWGFASDPIALTRCFIKDNCLYIDYEAGGVGVDFDEIPQLFDSIPDVRKWEIKADSARPETISYVKQKGFNIISCPKWKGSVEDGIGYLRSFEKIYIHPRCKNTYKEFQLYSYKTDKNSGEVLPIILDKDNHYIDSLRYALNSYIQKNVSILDVIDD